MGGEVQQNERVPSGEPNTRCSQESGRETREKATTRKRSKSGSKSTGKKTKKDRTENIKVQKVHFRRRVLIKMYCVAKFLTILQNLRTIELSKEAKDSAVTKAVADLEKVIHDIVEKALHRALIQRRAESRRRPRIFQHNAEHDKFSDEDLSDSDNSDSDDDMNLTEQERFAKTVSKIEKKAEQAALLEIRAVESSGITLQDISREKILAKYIEKFTKECARWEAMLIQQELLNKKLRDYGQRFIDTASTVTSSVTKAFSLENLSLLGSAACTSAGKVYEMAVDLGSKLEVAKNEATEIIQPVLQRCLNELPRSSDTMQTQMIESQSTSGTILNTTAVASGLATVAEFGRNSMSGIFSMGNEVFRAIELRSSQTPSAEKEVVQGITVWCSKCKAERNTTDGVLCKNCSGPLPVLLKDQMKAFPPPSKSIDWSGQPLTILGGAFFVKMEIHETSWFGSSTFNKDTLFRFHCAWELDLSREEIQGEEKAVPLYTRWMIQFTGLELRELHETLMTQKKSVFKKAEPPLFPNEQREIEKKKGRGSKLKQIFCITHKGRSNQRQKKVPGTAYSSAEVAHWASIEESSIDELQMWFKAVLAMAHESSPGSGKDNQIFKFGFSEAFEVDRNVQLVKVAFKT